jgi:hypothetical protein
MARKPPKLDRAKVVAALRTLGRPTPIEIDDLEPPKGSTELDPLTAYEPSDEFVEAVLEIIRGGAEDGPPYNQFYDDELRRAHAHIHRILPNRVAYWRKMLENIQGQTYPGVADDKHELETLIRDAEIELNLPAFRHRMSERNQQNKDNVRGAGPDNKMRLAIMDLIQDAGYTKRQARDVALALIPAPYNAGPRQALGKVVYRRKKAQK